MIPRTFRIQDELCGVFLKYQTKDEIVSPKKAVNRFLVNMSLEISETQRAEFDQRGGLDRAFKQTMEGGFEDSINEMRKQMRNMVFNARFDTGVNPYAPQTGNWLDSFLDRIFGERSAMRANAEMQAEADRLLQIMLLAKAEVYRHMLHLAVDYEYHPDDPARH